MKDDLSRYLREAAAGDAILITRHNRAAGLLIGFASEDDWTDYRLLNDPEFQQKIDAAREEFRAGKGIRLEDL